MSKIGIAARALRLDIDQLQDLGLPAILHWEFSHFVVLVSVNKAGLTIHDPANGRRIVSWAEVSRQFTGVAVEATPAHDYSQDAPAPRIKATDLLAPDENVGRAAVALGGVALAVESIGFLLPLLVQLVVDNSISSGDYDILVVIATGFCLLVLVHGVLFFTRSIAAIAISRSLVISALRSLMSRLTRLTVSFFERRTFGEIVSRFTSLESIQRTLTLGFIENGIDGLFAVVAFAALMIYSPTLALIALGFIGIYAIVRRWLFGRIQQASDVAIKFGASQQSSLMETVQGMQAVKLYGFEEERTRDFHNIAVRKVNAESRVATLTALGRTSNQVLFGLEAVACVCLGARLVISGELSLGMLYAAIAYKGQLVQRSAGLIDKLIELKLMNLHAQRVADILLSPIDAPTTEQSPLTAPPRLEAKALGFSYGPDTKSVFSGISFKVDVGEIIAITGPSGCGKTTLVKLLLGFCSPTSGEIYFNDQRMLAGAARSSGARIAGVLQDDTLFSGTVSENIALFDLNANASEVERAASLAQIHDDIVALPMKYWTKISEHGSGLSAGQRQRILLARAFYRRPQFLALDEATSSLDTPTQAAILRAIRSTGATTILVAHRAEVVRFADRVIELAPNLAPRLLHETYSA